MRTKKEIQVLDSLKDELRKKWIKSKLQQYKKEQQESGTHTLYIDFLEKEIRVIQYIGHRPVTIKEEWMLVTNIKTWKLDHLYPEINNKGETRKGYLWNNWKKTKKEWVEEDKILEEYVEKEWKNKKIIQKTKKKIKERKRD